MKEKIKKYWWVIIIILIISGVFCWYELRPSLIRSYCSKQALELGIKSKLAEGLGEYEFFYKACIRTNGLEK